MRRELDVRYNSFYPRLVKLLKKGVVERRNVPKYGYGGVLEWRMKAQPA